MLTLHCVVCALHGTRPTRDSEIAVIDEAVLRLPLAGSMFKDLDPERHIPKRLGGDTFETMKCLRHGGSPWGLNLKELMAARKLGGAWRLLTNEGWIRINKEGIAYRPGVRPELVLVDSKYGGPKFGEVLFLNTENLEVKDPKPADTTNIPLHYATEDGKPPPRDFVCRKCAKSFSSARGLAGHMKVHYRKKGKK